MAQLVGHRAVAREVVNSTPAGKALRIFKGGVSRLCACANCHVSPFNAIVIETIESTDAGNGNNPIVMDYSLELLL